MGVREQNPRVIRTYKTHGYVEFYKPILKIGNDEQRDIMVKLKLK